MDFKDIDENYFDSYEDLEVHRLMLTDRIRTETYQDAILSNKDLFRDSVIMDVGAGTGILSLFCAKAGAKKVYAVEASSLAQVMNTVIEENKFSHIIEVLNIRVEDVILPPDVKVDIIVSEWMGFYLLHEGMLDSVLQARDKFLKSDGKMFPESAVLYASPCSVPEMYSLWDNIYGINMSAFSKEMRKVKSNKPEVMQLKEDDLLSKGVKILEIDLLTVETKVLDNFVVRTVTTSKKGSYQGLCVWFSCTFPSHDDKSPLTLSTSPLDPPTHWKQTVIVFPDEYVMEEGEPIAWELMLSRSNDSPRHYDIQFSMLDPEDEEHPLPCSCYMTKCIVARTLLECEVEKVDVDMILEDD